MFSAGFVPPQPQPQQQVITGQDYYDPRRGGYGYQNNPYAAQQSTGLPLIQPIATPAPRSSGINLSVSGEAGEGVVDEMLRRNMALDEKNSQMQTVGMGINAGISLLNGITSWAALGIQNSAISKHYDYMNRVADNGMEVSLAQVNLQEKALDYQKIMLEEQDSHVEELARIEQRTQIRIAKIAQNGKTDRAGIYAANNAFRNEYPNYGVKVG